MCHLFRQENPIAFSGYPFSLIQACFCVRHIHREVPVFIKMGYSGCLGPKFNHSDKTKQNKQDVHATSETRSSRILGLLT